MYCFIYYYQFDGCLKGVLDKEEILGFLFCAVIDESKFF